MATPEDHLETAAALHEMLEQEQVPEERMPMAFLALSHNAMLSMAGSLIEIRDLLREQHICAHGVRGWCPSCHMLNRQNS